MSNRSLLGEFYSRVKEGTCIESVPHTSTFVMDGLEIEQTKYIPSFLLNKTVYLIEDSSEEEELMADLEKDWSAMVSIFKEQEENGLLICTEDSFGAKVNILYFFFSGCAWIRYENDVGAVSFGCIEVEGL